MNKRKFAAFLLVMELLMLVLMVLVFTTPAARAQDQQGLPTSVFTITNLPTSIAASTVSNQTSVITLRQDRNLTMQFNFALSGAGTGSLRLWAKPTVDGTNYITTANQIILLDMPGNGTTQVIGGTNVPKSVLESYRAVQIYAISNADASRTIFLTNGVYGFRN